MTDDGLEAAIRGRLDRLDEVLDRALGELARSGAEHRNVAPHADPMTRARVEAGRGRP